MDNLMTLSFFDNGVQKMKVPSCASLFSNLKYRATPKIVPALYQETYYPFYFLLAKYFQPKSILEIGTRFGYSLIALAMGAEKQGIRPSIVSVDMESYSHEFGAISSQEIAKANFTACLGNLDRTRFESCSSHDLCVDKLGTFDLIHVDGDHSESGAFNDITRFYDPLNPGGMMLIDDIDNPKVYKAVQRAVSSLEIEPENRAVMPTKHGCCLIKKAA